MQLPVKPVYKRVRKDGTATISIQYCYSSEIRTLLDTGIVIPVKYWDKQKCCISRGLPPVYGSRDDLNSEISRLTHIVEELLAIARRKKITNPLTFIKETFQPGLDEKALKEKEAAVSNQMVTSNLDIYYQIDDYIKSKEKKVCKDMPRIYRNMKEHLKAFEDFKGKAITFDSLDLNFYEEFVDFLTFDYMQRRRKDAIIGLKVNTVGKTIKQFRTFLRNRMRKKIIAPIDMDGWRILEEDVDAVYLNTEEINALYNLDLSTHPHLINYRNDFVLGCLTGLRFSDFSELVKDDLRKDMLFKKQNKSEYWVVIPLRDEALEILKNRFSNNVSTPTNAEFNRHIKTVTKLASISDLIKFSHKKHGRDVIEIKPKYEWITSHTCRRSFCTNEFLTGTPVELIMKISGHKSVKDFYKYIRITPEEAGQKIKELWKSRGGMNAFGNGNKIAS